MSSEVIFAPGVPHVQPGQALTPAGQALIRDWIAQLPANDGVLGGGFGVTDGSAWGINTGLSPALP